MRERGRRGRSSSNSPANSVDTSARRAQSWHGGAFIHVSVDIGHDVRPGSSATVSSVSAVSAVAALVVPVAVGAAVRPRRGQVLRGAEVESLWSSRLRAQLALRAPGYAERAAAYCSGNDVMVNKQRYGSI